MYARQIAKGFTLVEILIVVVILGILAAIVIPQFTNASESAKSSSLVSQLQTLRSQLELYQVQHNGQYPTLGTTLASWDQMTKKTLVDGTVPADQTTGKYGPYLQQPSVNPFEDSFTVAAAAAQGVGWVYNSTTGEIYAVVSSTKAKEVNLSADGTDTADVKTY